MFFLRNDIVGQAFINVMSQNQHCTIVANQIWIDSFSSKNYMINFWISNSVFKCLAESMHTVDVYKFVLSNETYNGKFNSFLQTT